MSLTKLKSSRATIRESFFAYGWLMPTILPLAQIGGRALFDILAYFYILWALISLYGKKITLDRWVITLYGALLVAFFLGVPNAKHSDEALKEWIVFSLRSLIFLFTWVALQQDVRHLERLQNALGIGGVLTLIVLYITLIDSLQAETFLPKEQLKEDNLPFLLPFILAWAYRRTSGSWRNPALLTLFLSLFTYVIISQGRAALLASIVATTVFGLTVLNWRFLRLSLVVLAMFAIGITANITSFLRTPDQNSAWVYTIDAITSSRTLLWRQALNHPPEQPWIGVGMDHGRYAEELLTIGEERVKHFHNFIIDAWYETGLLGAILLVSLIGYTFIKLFRVWHHLTPGKQKQAGSFLAAALGIITAASLSFSYTSPYFSIYLFLCLGVLSHMANSAFVQQH